MLNNDYEFYANIHGISLDSEETGNTPEVNGKTDEHTPLFGDPADYAHLSSEEKNHLTDKMIGKHKHWVDSKKV